MAITFLHAHISFFSEYDEIVGMDILSHVDEDLKNTLLELWKIQTSFVFQNWFVTFVFAN